MRIASFSMRSIACATSSSPRDRAHPVELGVAAHRDERGAQLVARIADEAAHLPHRRVALRDCGIHPTEHRVDRDFRRPTSVVIGSMSVIRWLKSPAAIAIAVDST